MNRMNPAVDFYFNKAQKWQEALEHLRAIVLDCGLTEELKWGVPCYTLQGRNVVLMHVFKDYCALLFVKGALLKDSQGILIQQTENTQSARQVRFAEPGEVAAQVPTLHAYVQEAIAVEQAGLKVEYKKTTEYVVPEELQHKFAETPGLQAAFGTLTPGRQRAYLLHFTAPKLAQTRESRVAKCAPQILLGKGLHD